MQAVDQVDAKPVEEESVELVDGNGYRSSKSYWLSLMVLMRMMHTRRRKSLRNP
jgi:hypothetical protein